MGIFTDFAIGGLTQFGEVAEKDTATNIAMAQNSLNKENLPHDIEFMQKFSKRKTRDSSDFLKPIDFHDFHFRVNFKEERKLYKNKPEIENLLNNWKDSKKKFRFIKRFTFIHRDYPFKIDCSIIKTSRKKKYYIPEYSIQDANVFNNPENYEIEMEKNITERWKMDMQSDS